jgi:hypothetical protein
MQICDARVAGAEKQNHASNSFKFSKIDERRKI